MLFQMVIKSTSPPMEMLLQYGIIQATTYAPPDQVVFLVEIHGNAYLIC